MNYLLKLIAAATGAVMVATAAHAYGAYTTGSVNMRSGPSTQYRVMATVPRGSGIAVHSCGHRRSWCHASWGGLTGYVHGRYVATGQRPAYCAPPVVAPYVVGSVALAAAAIYARNRYYRRHRYVYRHYHPRVRFHRPYRHVRPYRNHRRVGIRRGFRHYGYHRGRFHAR